MSRAMLCFAVIVSLSMITSISGQCSIQDLVLLDTMGDSDPDVCIDNAMQINVGATPLIDYTSDPNADLSTTNVIEGTQVSVTCDTGFVQFESDTKITCTGGVWTGSLPECRAGDCQKVWRTFDPNSIAYTDTVVSATTWVRHSGSATLTCASGYTAVGSNSSECIFGEWDTILGYCKENDCANIDSSLTEGMVGYSTNETELTPPASLPAGTGAYNDCPDGYVLPLGTDGTPDPESLVYTVRCDEEEWEYDDASDTLDGCIPLGCPANLGETMDDLEYDGGVTSTVTLSSSADADGMIASGETATLTCPSGYTLGTGANSEATCNLGVWSNALGPCVPTEPIFCNASEINHCSTSPTGTALVFSEGSCNETSVETGNAVAVSCETGSGYILPISEPTVLTCQAGVWIGAEDTVENNLITCEKIPCCQCWNTGNTGGTSVVYKDAGGVEITSGSEVPFGGSVVVTCSGIPLTFTCGQIDIGLWDGTPSCQPV